MLNAIYDRLRLITNYFTQVAQLVKKRRTSSRLPKIYDRPRPPYVRVLNSKHISRKVKDKLKWKRAQLNPAQLRREMVDMQGKLFNMGRKVSGYKINYGGVISQSEENFVYIR